MCELESNNALLISCVIISDSVYTVNSGVLITVEQVFSQLLSTQFGKESSLRQRADPYLISAVRRFCYIYSAYIMVTLSVHQT